MGKYALIGGFAACACLFLVAVYEMTYCDKKCQDAKHVRAERQRVAALPPPPPPLPSGTNTTNLCDGIQKWVFEPALPFRKFPEGGRRSNWMGDQHSNPCAVYFEIVNGKIAFGVDYGAGIRSWVEGPGRTQWPVKFDLVTGVRGADGIPSWKYITCREWHPVMKQWRCR